MTIWDGDQREHAEASDGGSPDPLVGLREYSELGLVTLTCQHRAVGCQRGEIAGQPGRFVLMEVASALASWCSTCRRICSRWEGQRGPARQLLT